MDFFENIQQLDETYLTEASYKKPDRASLLSIAGMGLAGWVVIGIFLSNSVF